jgi:hypothetical protein
MGPGESISDKCSKQLASNTAAAVLAACCLCIDGSASALRHLGTYQHRKNSQHACQDMQAASSQHASKLLQPAAKQSLVSKQVAVRKVCLGICLYKMLQQTLLTATCQETSSPHSTQNKVLACHQSLDGIARSSGGSNKCTTLMAPTGINRACMMSISTRCFNSSSIGVQNMQTARPQHASKLQRAAAKQSLTSKQVAVRKVCLRICLSKGASADPSYCHLPRA